MYVIDVIHDSTTHTLGEYYPTIIDKNKYKID